jgi:hypothetical protein
MLDSMYYIVVCGRSRNNRLNLEESFPRQQDETIAPVAGQWISLLQYCKHVQHNAHRKHGSETLGEGVFYTVRLLVTRD